MAITKQRKLEEKTEATTMKKDIISSLPDSLLCHILSFLPTRSSMATSILSRRWRHLWKDTQIFDNAGKPFYTCEHSVAFINAVLAQLRVRRIQKFRLLCVTQKASHDTVITWICTAIGPHLQELDLFLYVNFDGFLLPDGIFTCTSLVSLTLNGWIFWYNPSSVHLPSLKNLELDIAYCEPIDKLLSGCPILETLKLAFHEGCRMAIHMPHSLKSLTFEVDYHYDDDDDIEDLKIDTPSLEYLHIKLRPTFLIYFVSNFPNMMEAHLDIFPDDMHVGWIPKLLKALCRTKLLALTNRITECLLRAPALHFPKFCCLVHLRLDFQCFNSRFLIHFLSNCDMLQVLIIHNLTYKGEHSESSSWTLPTSVPNCVISQLKNFEFEGYQDSVDEHAFTAFLLQRGLVLETMTIHPNVRFCLEKKYHILKELSTIPRGSITCQLKFD